ncbi:cytochrome aa3 quinol oxidase subunit IV [Alicyclobacillus acidocaldarius]|uniref:Quinol oxidase subunit 4 n=2 Tax=Alicyclobacillus acidocaldarius subsp. acidocaldarius TaxID=1388 RepID=C8WTG7_ALIAD|nr:cytochrome aa3 quinol oxidase subunit IV [Alicyclobacillus acidocaldarius]ACV57709.1 cytochrome aa3 quinol oxidase, subunit IV [Alicyclobacillus acidocaldarius subsp. acidocaldarius DSM 446]AEJ42588.1 cytochrome aa3 quinol oxidase, subunit IV [Alicyclobacillus acidocaldarius subsp. acidocaldarius Tc-4-1]
MEAKEHKFHREEGFPWKHILGLFLSLLLTAIAFWLALATHQPPALVITIIVILGVGQLLVQLYMFMHFTESDDRAWQVPAIYFGLFIVFCVVGGSIWIMTFKSIVA